MFYCHQDSNPGPTGEQAYLNGAINDVKVSSQTSKNCLYAQLFLNFERFFSIIIAGNEDKKMRVLTTLLVV